MQSALMNTEAEADILSQQSCAEDSIEDHSAYLLGAKNGSRKRYAGLTKTKSYKKQLQIIKKGGYATSGSYVNDLCRVIRTYNLTKWDK